MTTIDPDIQVILDEFVKQINAKEEDLLFLKREIDGVVADAKQELKAAETELDVKFDAYTISEEEYLHLFREARDRITAAAKVKLDAVVQGIGSVSAQREAAVAVKRQQIEDIKEGLDQPE